VADRGGYIRIGGAAHCGLPQAWGLVNGAVSWRLASTLSMRLLLAIMRMGVGLKLTGIQVAVGLKLTDMQVGVGLKLTRTQVGVELRCQRIGISLA